MMMDGAAATMLVGGGGWSVEIPHEADEEKDAQRVKLLIQSCGINSAH